MDIVSVKDAIERLILEVGKCRREIEAKGLEKARTLALYDVKLGGAIQVLREEGKFPATLIEKIAKKICADDRKAMEEADILYKSCISNLEALKAQLNAYQSIYRYSE
jgi:hypothetical protein